MNDLIAFLETLPGVKNLRVYTGEELLQIDPKTETPFVRRAIIRAMNSKKKHNVIMFSIFCSETR